MAPEERKNGLWAFLNSPLVVVIVGVTLWAGLQMLTTHLQLKQYMGQVMDKYTNLTHSLHAQLGGSISNRNDSLDSSFRRMMSHSDQPALDFVKYSGQVVVTNIQQGTARSKAEEKYFASVVNNSDRMLRDVALRGTFYGADGKAIDVDDGIYSRIPALPPFSTNVITVTRRLGDYNDSNEMLNSNRAARVDISVASFSVVESAP